MPPIIREVKLNQTTTELLMDAVLVQQLTAAISAKLNESRQRGRFGWWSERIYPPHALREIIKDHLERDDILDVCILAGMLWVKENVLTEMPSEEP